MTAQVSGLLNKQSTLRPAMTERTPAFRGLLLVERHQRALDSNRKNAFDTNYSIQK